MNGQSGGRCEVAQRIRQARAAASEGNSALVSEILDAVIPQLEEEFRTEVDPDLRIRLAEVVISLICIRMHMINRELKKVLSAA